MAGEFISEAEVRLKRDGDVLSLAVLTEELIQIHICGPIIKPLAVMRRSCCALMP